MSARFFLRRFWRGFAGAEERGGFIFERSDFPNRKFPERRNGILPYRGIRFWKNEVRLGRRPHFCDFRKGKAGLKCPAQGILCVLYKAPRKHGRIKKQVADTLNNGRAPFAPPAGMGMRGRRGTVESSKWNGSAFHRRKRAAAHCSFCVEIEGDVISSDCGLSNKSAPKTRRKCGSKILFAQPWGKAMASAVETFIRPVYGRSKRGTGSGKSRVRRGLFGGNRAQIQPVGGKM